MLWANIMAHNERPFIAHALDELLQFVDNIIVQDNGSMDGTQDIVQDYANREPRIQALHVQQGQTPNYAALRNNMLQHVPDGHWVLWWDPDELPTQGLKDIARKGMLIPDEDRIGGISLPIWHIMHEPRLCLPMEVGWPKVRIFKQTPNTRFAGHIHEQPHFPGATYGQYTPDRGIGFVHLSYYAPKRLRRKSAAYAQIPGSGFTTPDDLPTRLNTMTAVPLPDHVQYNESILPSIREAR